MKKNILILIAIFIHSTLYSQVVNNRGNNLPEEEKFNLSTGAFENPEKVTTYDKKDGDFKLTDFDYDCSTDFWTTNSGGSVRQWSLVNGTITGGDIILFGAGSSIAFCGGTSSPTFYTTDFISMGGIRYYDSPTNWVTIATPFHVSNNGGYANHQYYMRGVEGQNKVLYYFDGTNLKTLDSLGIEEAFSVADVAVDTLGRAWVFKGDSPFFSKTLNIYDSTGLITSYSIAFNSLHGYGSFFLNDQLYVGLGSTGSPPNTIMPIIVDGDSAKPGVPIPFTSDSFSDMAGCQSNEPVISSISQVSNNQINIFPNPTTGIIHFPTDINITHIEVYNLEGQLIVKSKQKKILNLTSLPKGIYFLYLGNEKDRYVEKFIKI